MSLLVLIGLVFIGLALAAAATVARRAGARPEALGTVRGLSVSLAVLVAALFALLLARGGVPSSLPIPFGTPVGSTGLALDAIGLAFGLPVATGGVFLLWTAQDALLWRAIVLFGGTLLALTAGDGIALLGSVAAVGLAAWGASAEVAVSFLLAAGALAPLLGGGGIEAGDGFASLRAIGAADGGGTLGAVCALGLTGLFLGRPSRLPGAEGMLAGLGAFLFVRLAIDLGGGVGAFPTGPALALLALAVALAATGTALLAVTLDRVGAALSLVGNAVVLLLLGVGALARAADLPGIDAASVSAVLLLLSVLAIAVPLLASALRLLSAEAGGLRLASLGGLAGQAPRLSLVLASLFGTLAFVPPLPGFVPGWMAVDLLLRPDRFGGSTRPVFAMLVLAVFALVLGLSLVGVLRVGTIVLLGRPRSPRAAAAVDPADPLVFRPYLAGLVLLGILALLPGPVLGLLSPGIATVTGGAEGARASILAVGTVDGGAVLVPLLLAAPLLAGLVARRTRDKLEAPADPVPAWDGGAAPSPDWLPFGEPRAQVSAPFAARLLGDTLGVAAAPGTLIPGEGVRVSARPAAAWRRGRLAARRIGRRVLARNGRPAVGWRANADLSLVALLGIVALLGEAFR